MKTKTLLLHNTGVGFLLNFRIFHVYFHFYIERYKIFDNPQIILKSLIENIVRMNIKKNQTLIEKIYRPL